MSLETEQAQARYIADGGAHRPAMNEKIRRGEMAQAGEYQYQEYPKMLHISQGVQDVPWTSETIKGVLSSGTQRKEVFREIIVRSEDEEDRVLNGGKTRDEVEAERRELILRARGANILVDQAWSTVRLRRELGEAPDVTDPEDEMASLNAKLERLQEMAAMKAKIAALETELAGKPAAPVAQMNLLKPDRKEASHA